MPLVTTLKEIFSTVYSHKGVTILSLSPRPPHRVPLFKHGSATMQPQLNAGSHICYTLDYYIGIGSIVNSALILCTLVQLGSIHCTLCTHYTLLSSICYTLCGHKV